MARIAIKNLYQLVHSQGREIQLLRQELRIIRSLPSVEVPGIHPQLELNVLVPQTANEKVVVAQCIPEFVPPFINPWVVYGCAHLEETLEVYDGYQQDRFAQALKDYTIYQRSEAKKVARCTLDVTYHNIAHDVNGFGVASRNEVTAVEQERPQKEAEEKTRQDDEDQEYNAREALRVQELKAKEDMAENLLLEKDYVGLAKLVRQDAEIYRMILGAFRYRRRELQQAVVTAQGEQEEAKSHFLAAHDLHLRASRLATVSSEEHEAAIMRSQAHQYHLSCKQETEEAQKELEDFKAACNIVFPRAP